MEFASFRLDTVNQCLWRRVDSGAEEHVFLPPKAFAVLSSLLDHAGRLVTEDELLHAVWPNVVVQHEVIKSQIYEIRKALGDNANTPQYIETLPRRGYRFIAPIRLDSSKILEVIGQRAHGRLVGRDGTIAKLRAHLQKASKGQREIIFITGEAGIGKTAVADEFQRKAAVDLPKIRIARGQCIEGYGGKEAYYPMLEALSTLCHGSSGERIIEILTSQAPTWLYQFPALLTPQRRKQLQEDILGATRERMLREIAHALDTIAAETPLLLVFEDLQWVDYSTLDLLSAVARGRATVKLILIITTRPIDAVLVGHPFTALKQELLVHQLCHNIDLEPLTETDIAAYLAAESPADGVPDGLAQLLHRRSEGNPLFVVSALDHLTRRGLITRVNGTWRLSVPLERIDPGVPESLRGIIEAQIERLSTEEQRAMEAASIAGNMFSATIVAAAVGSDEEHFEHLCETVARRHRMIRSVGTQQFPDGSMCMRYEFVHALYRDVLYHRQPSRRQSRLHQRVAERIEALYAQQLSDVAAELAYHFEKSSDSPRTVKYLRRAAEAAARRYGHREAIALLERALALANKLSDSQRVASGIEILQILAPMYALSLAPRALETYEALVAQAAQFALIDVEVNALVEMAEYSSWTNTQHGLELIDRALARSAQQIDPFARARSRMRCAYLRIWASGWNNEDASVCRSAMSEIRQAGNRPLIAPHLIDYSNFLFWCSEYRESHRTALEGLSILAAGSKSNPCASLPQAIGAWIAYCDLMFLGDWGAALREVESAIAALIKNANDWFAHALGLWRAWLHFHAMDFPGALEICESSARLGGGTWISPNHRFYLVLTGAVYVALGDHKRALERLSRARREMDQRTIMTDWYYRAVLESAFTELWLAEGDLAQARAQGEKYLAVTLATAERTWQALAWEANARVAMADGDLTHADQFIANALSTLEGFELPLASWRVHATAAAYEERAGDPEAAERHRELSCETILKIADSLAPEDPLRKTFLSASPVAKILGNLVTNR